MDIIDLDFLNDFSGQILSFISFLILLLLIFLFLKICATWKIYKKAGKRGWEAFIPYYSNWVLVEVAGLNWWWFLLILSTSIVTILKIDVLTTVASLASSFATFSCFYNIAKKFGKTTGTSVCAGIFSSIFVLIFGFSKSEIYDNNIPVSKNGVFGKPEIANYTNFNNSTNNDDSNGSSTEFVDNNSTFCSNCGTQMTKDAKFCPNCGKEFV